jgi:hypothetical protein
MAKPPETNFQAPRNIKLRSPLPLWERTKGEGEDFEVIDTLT